MNKYLLRFGCMSLFASLCVSVNAIVYTGYCGNDGEENSVTWSFDDTNGTLTISGTGTIKEHDFFTGYPWNIQTGDVLFFNPWDNDGNFTGVRKLVIEEGITRIPNYAFGQQKNLTSVSLPSTLKSIGDYALDYGAFTQITLPESLETIGEGAFQGAQLSKIILPKSLTDIGDFAFQECKNLTSIVIPQHVTKIGDGAFYGCTALTSVIALSDNPSTIGECVFECSINDENVIIPSLADIKVLENSVNDYKGAANWSEYASLITPAILTTVTYTATEKIPRFEELGYFVGAEYLYAHDFEIPVGSTVGNGEVVYVGKVTEFGNYCLQINRGLISIDVPEGVKKLGFQAFKWCDKLKDISLPTTLENIGDVSGLAFEGCTALSNGHFIIKDLKWWCDLDIKGVYSNPVYYAKHIYDAQGNEIIDLVIPDDVTSVGDYTFARCEGLKSVTFHDSVTYIGSSAFSECAGLTKVDLPKKMKVLSEYAFSRCSNLVSVTIPEGMEELGFCAFNYCGLKSLTLPSTISKMSQSFHNCEQLDTLKLTNGISDIGGSFYSCNSLKEVRIPGSLKTMTYQDFMRCEKLETVIIEEGVEEVAGFQECPRLVNLTIPSSAKTLGGLGFRDCSSLVTVNLPEGVEYIASFDGCTSLRRINIPSTVTYVGTFKNCTSLDSVIIDNLKSWCEAEHYDSNLYGPQKMAGKIFVETNNEITEITELVIPAGTTKVEGGAFCHLPHLTSVSIPGTVKYLGGLTFTGCTGLTEITLPEGLEKFGYMDFAGCKKLTELTIPSTVNYIDVGAFVEMDTIQNVWCYAFPNELYWDSYDSGDFFLPNKTTKFHVVNATAWQETFPNANVTYVGDIMVEMSTITYHAYVRQSAFDDYTKFKGAYSLISHTFSAGLGTVRYQGEVNGIGSSAFRNMEDLTSVSLPEGTTRIDNYAFQGCSSLTTMTIPAAVTAIGDYAFSGCTKLTSLIIEDPAVNAKKLTQKKTTSAQENGLQAIGRRAFENCPLTKLVLPATLNDIEEEAFCGLSQLAGVYCKADAANVTWRGSDNSNMFMAGKATNFHVYDATAWATKYPDANVTYVGDLLTGVEIINRELKENNQWYDLNGRRLNKNQVLNGLFILNGCKVIVK